MGYHALADLLRDEIQSGRLRPGQRLPSEMTLAQTYGVAGKTARAALQQVRSEGLAVSVRGYGVVVREPVEPEVVYLQPGDRVRSRAPTPTERADYEVPEGWHLLVVTHPDGLQDLYPADRTEIATPEPESP